MLEKFEVARCKIAAALHWTGIVRALAFSMRERLTSQSATIRRLKPTPQLP